MLSHDGKVDVGIIACPDLVDDVSEVADRFVAAVAELVGLCTTDEAEVVDLTDEAQTEEHA